MAQLPPIPSVPGRPQKYLLNAGTRLTRIHSIRFLAAAFNPTLAEVDSGGGRFDGTAEDPYGFLYAGGTDACAISEAVLRDYELNPAGGRLLPRILIQEKAISWIRPTLDLTLVKILDAQDFGALQLSPSWLSQSHSSDYPHTRRWCQAIRQWAGWAQGLVWTSKLNPPAQAFVFFDDRLPARPTSPFEEMVTAVPYPPGTNRLDIGAAHNHLLAILGDLHFSLSP